LIADQMPTKAILLFNDECVVCRRIAHWAERSAQRQSGGPSIIVRPIGDDPEALRSLHQGLDIWDAYANLHVLMPDESMKLNGEAVAETLRSLPSARWFTRSFDLSVFGLRPFQALLNLAYAILADMRPILGCESCGIPPPWLRPFHWIVQRVRIMFKAGNLTTPTAHLTLRPAVKATNKSNAA
jgi:predicted DCC family thiol-disulfide oxidoreductase YuxK